MKKNQELIRKSAASAFWGVIGITFIFTRIWHLTEIPFGLHIDEASMAYSAWCLSQYGVDRYLDSWPIYFLNFGGGQSPLYAYLLAGLFKIFGFHIALIRIPSVFFSLLTLIFTILVSKLVFLQYKYVPYAIGILMVICPYYIMAGRLGLDCNLMLGCSAMFFYCFVKAIKSEKNKWYILAGISGGIMLYSYALSYVMLPVFLLIAMCYIVFIHKFLFGKWFIMAVPMAVLAVPLILEQIVNMFGLEPIKLGIFTITRMDNYRASEFGRMQFDNVKMVLENIFVGDTLAYNSAPGFHNLYWISIPLAIAGLAGVLWKLMISLRKKEICLDVFVFFWFFSVAFVVCHISSCVNRVNSIFFAYALLVVEGGLLFVKLNDPGRKIVYGVILLVYMGCFIKFGQYYYGGAYVRETYPISYFDILTTEAINFIEKNPQYGGKGAQMAQQPIYFGLSTLRSPYELCLFDQDVYVLEYYHCSHLGEIEDGYYYIVNDTYRDYSEELRSNGYTEIAYSGYSLFYQE